MSLEIIAARNLDVNPVMALDPPIRTAPFQLNLTILALSAEVTGAIEVDEGNNLNLAIEITGFFDNASVPVVIEVTGQAQDGSDYNITRNGNPQTITNNEFSVNYTSNNNPDTDEIPIVLITLDDPLPDTETVIFRVVSVDGNNVANNNLTVTINDDDAFPVFLIANEAAVGANDMDEQTNALLGLDCVGDNPGDACNEDVVFLALPLPDQVQSYEFFRNGVSLGDASNVNSIVVQPQVGDLYQARITFLDNQEIRTDFIEIINVNTSFCEDDPVQTIFVQDLNPDLYSRINTIDFSLIEVFAQGAPLTKAGLTLEDGFLFDPSAFNEGNTIRLTLRYQIGIIFITEPFTGISIRSTPSPNIIGPTNTCQGIQTTYTVGSPGNSSFNWNISNGSFIGASNQDTVVVVWNAGPGTLTVTENNQACVGSAMIDITASADPTPTIVGPEFVCVDPLLEENISIFEVQNSGIQNSWSLSDPTLADQATELGNAFRVAWNPINSIQNVDINLSSQNGPDCSNDLSFAVVLIPKSKARFSLETSNQLFRVELDANASRGPIERYLWTSPATHSIEYLNSDSSEVAFTFTNPGQKTIQLVTFPSTNPQHFICADTANVTFTLGNDGWMASNEIQETVNGQNLFIPQGDNYSWDFTQPSENIGIFNIQTPDSVWVTSNNPDPSIALNSYSINESSFIESPVFPLDTFDFPMVSMDIWFDNEEQSDGALLIYRADSDTSWQRLGFIQGGDNWYNQENILAKPGDPFVTETNGNPERMGWTGESQGWLNAKFALDAAGVGGDVRFRLVFNTNAANPARTLDGMAFRNFRVVERRRLVLIEHFTNSLADNLSPGFVSAEDDSITVFVNDLLNENTVDLRYHTSFPTDDPIQTSRDNENLESKADISARGLFYGVSQLPHTVIDGFISLDSDTRFNPEGERAHSRRILAEPLIDISQVNIEKTAEDSLSIQVIIEKESQFFNLPASILQVCLAEIDPNSPGTRHIVRKFIPNISGAARFSEDDLGAPLVVDVPNW
ncbi:MAG: hypothetical protein AAFU64_02615, partial [Bacteroidota bacterium]